MLRSLSSGVSGLRNQQIKLDVIGNNIANVNTVGYKSHRVNFQEQFSQTLRGGSAPTTALGGTNPSQVGLGVSVGSIDLIQTQGALTPTYKNTDLAISGEGFFILSDGRNSVFTRDGAFDFDRSGNFLKVSNGFRVMGWNSEVMPDGTARVNTNRPIEPIVVPAGITLTPQATTSIRLSSNLEAQTPKLDRAYPRDSQALASISMFDSQGNTIKGTIVFTRQAEETGKPETANRWQIAFKPQSIKDFRFVKSDGKLNDDPQDSVVNKIIDGTGARVDENAVLDEKAQADLRLVIGYVEFGPNGVLTAFREPANGQVPNPANPAGPTIPGIVAKMPSAGAPVLTTLPTFRLAPSTSANPLTLQLEVGTPGRTDGLTQYTDPTSDPSKKFYNHTAVMVDQNGYGSGNLSGVSLDASGSLMGVFTNGRSRVLGQVAVSTFTNPSGLAVAGDNVFTTTANSGEPQVGTPATGSRGMIAPGTLENSNVDLAQSFSELIVAQRSLQSNSKVITTSDEVLQELMSLKR
jgi:flagellar hook protein FlgE